MRILIAHAAYRIPGGEDRYVQQQAELLGPHHDVELFVARNDELGSEGAAARRMLAPGQTRRSLGDLAGRFEPDLIHVHNVYPSLGASVHQLCRAREIPLVMTVHNHRLRCPNGYCFTEGEICHRCTGGNHVHAVLHECFPSRKQAIGYASALWIDRFVRRIERAVDLFIAPSEYMGSRLVEWGIEAERVTVIRNFTTMRLSRPSSDRYGVFAGRLSSEKGLDVLLRALAKAGDPPFEVVGDGPEQVALERLAAELKLSRLIFHGRMPAEDAHRVVGAARYFVMPSLWNENAPLAVFEAMAAGVPAIVTRRGGLTELEQMVVEAGDVTGLADAIDRLRHDGPLRDELAANARRFAVDHLTADAHRGKLEAAYAAVVR
jgi:glycosyltransferase involved in cell wall biosynthesis